MTFLRLAVDGNVTQAKGITEKRAMLADLDSDDLLLAAWTGNYSTDISFWTTAQPFATR